MLPHNVIHVLNYKFFCSAVRILFKMAECVGGSTKSCKSSMPLTALLKKPATKNSIFKNNSKSNAVTAVEAAMFNANGIQKFKLTSPQPLKIATEFTGMGGGFIACNSVVDCNHVVACETDPTCGNVLQWQVLKLLEKGCEAREEDHLQIYDKADVIISTAPCKDFSQTGKKKGTSCKRRKVVYQMCRHLRRKKVKAAIMENNWALANKKHKAILFTIMKVAKECGWFSKFLKLDAKYFGVAQTRRRCYGVFTNHDHKKREFLSPVLWARRMTLAKLLSFKRCQNIPCKLSKHPRERAIQMETFKNLFANKKNKIDPRATPAATDIDASKGWAAMGVNIVPCLLHSRCKGPYISTRGGRLDHEEAALLQNYHYNSELKARHLDQDVSIGQSISMLGDAVTKPVMAACFLEVLYAIGQLDSLPHHAQIRACVFLNFPTKYIESWDRAKERQTLIASSLSMAISSSWTRWVASNESTHWGNDLTVSC